MKGTLPIKRFFAGSVLLGALLVLAGLLGDPGVSGARALHAAFFKETIPAEHGTAETRTWKLAQPSDAVGARRMVDGVRGPEAG